MQRVPGAPTPLVCSVGTASMVGVAASDPSPFWVLAPEGDALWVPPSRGERGANLPLTGRVWDGSPEHKLPREP